MKFSKGAMFGLEARVLRKQSGRLFLARLRRLTFRLVEGHQASQIKTSQGAMFGLDARIALAIFGALSVISGAALYSAIQQSKVTQLITSLKEIGKAWEQYYLDTGSYIDIDTTVNVGNKIITETKFLIVDSGVAGWNGPYLPFKTSSYAMNHDIYNNAHIFYMKNDKMKCDGSNDCYIWTSVNGVPPELAKAIDLKIDGVDSSSTGDFIYNNYTGIVGTKEVYLRYNPFTVNPSF